MELGQFDLEGAHKRYDIFQGALEGDVVHIYPDNPLESDALPSNAVDYYSDDQAPSRMCFMTALKQAAHDQVDMPTAPTFVSQP